MVILWELFIFFAVAGCVLIVALTVAFRVVANTSRGAVAAVTNRVDAREGRRLHWSAPVDGIAKAVIAEQPITFWVEYRRALGTHRVDFLLVPLDALRNMGSNGNLSPSGWHLWQSSRGRGGPTTVPIAGWDLVTRLHVPSDDAVPVRETWELLMRCVHDHTWGTAESARHEDGR